MKAKLSSKNQITIPKEAREFLGISPGDGLKIFKRPGGGVVLLPSLPVTRLKGMVPKLGKTLTVEDMNAAIREGATARVANR